MSVPYPANSYPRAHPDRLQAIAALYGGRPTPVENSVVLELGCGSGGQLIPMAQQLPSTRFIGLDIDSQAIAEAQEKSKTLELNNVEWLCVSVADWQPPRVDYIIAHGLFSWVPDEIRSAVWKSASQALKDHGVFFLSHICQPGASLRSMARAVMLSAHDASHSEEQNVRAGIAALEKTVELHGEDSVLGRAYLNTLNAVKAQHWGYVWHDFWVAGYKSFSIKEINAMAIQNDFQYLQDSDLKANLPLGVPTWLAAKVKKTSNLIDAASILDIHMGRSFRRGLWVRNSQVLKLSLAEMDHMFLRPQFTRHETDEGVLLVTETGEQLGFRGALASELTAEMLTMPEMAIEPLLSGHPDQTRQWLFSLFVAGAISLSVRPRTQNLPNQGTVRGNQTVVNAFHEPVTLSHFDAALINALQSGHRGLALVQELILSAQRGDFEARMDGHMPQSQAEWNQVIQGVLPARIQKLWHRGLWASPQIFGGA
ncbi:MAG: methyltransferase domain-containing protein [Myxococcota bacterium]|nr:methyltransferase domain-containing protein [Myxococcota bacterium]